MGQPIARLRGIQRTYQGSNPVVALRSLTLDIPAGTVTAVMGPSGSGKTTLLNILGLMDSPDAGDYSLNGKDVAQIGRRERTELRRRSIGFVFQSSHLLRRYSAIENVVLGMSYAEPSRPRQERFSGAEEALRLVGLGHRVHHTPEELSGGEQQRVALARALVRKPRLLLCDEPTGNLDEAGSVDILGLVRSTLPEEAAAVVASHDNLVLDIADRVLRLSGGPVHPVETL